MSTNGHEEEKETFALHWNKNVERRGLGNLIKKANHIGIAVSDIGRSAAFYSDFLGLQQIRRPNFDRHGAWFTMGNIELHLILGQPIVHSGKDLIVGHISLETDRIGEVKDRLDELQYPYETNVSVPKADGSGSIVTQFFLRDPDGYYIEVCNCDVLTKFCLGDEKICLNGYAEIGTKPVSLSIVTNMIALAERAKEHAEQEHEDDLDELLAQFEGIEKSDVDEVKLANLVKRLNIYGDIIQGETEESLRELMKKTGNDVPMTLRIIKAKHGDKQTFIPPAFYKNNIEKIVPAPIHIDHK